MSIHQIKLYKRNRKPTRKLLKEALEEMVGFINEKYFYNATWSDDYLFVTRHNNCDLYIKRAYESGTLLVLDGYTDNNGGLFTWGVELHKSNDLEDALIWIFDIDNILKEMI